MKTLALPLALLLSMAATSARAQVRFQIDIGLPVAPPLVMVEPGIQVVEGFRDEVFFSLGWYWCRRPDGWYRSRSPQARFAWVEARRVPRGLVRMPVGHYRNWHHGEARPLERRDDRRDIRRDDRRDDRRDGRRDGRRDDRRDDRRGEGRGQEGHGRHHDEGGRR
jgi:hypothetical protein